MSLEVLLIPAAIAAWQMGRDALEARAESKQESADKALISLATRIKSQEILVETLGEVGGELRTSGAALRHVIAGAEYVWERSEDGTWQVGASAALAESEIRAYLSAVNSTYGLHVQRTVLQRIQSRADALGMTIEETNRAADDSVHLLLTVNGQ